jgi:hypothetical protein
MIEEIPKKQNMKMNKEKTKRELGQLISIDSLELT